jgi:hypothetical protein
MQVGTHLFLAQDLMSGEQSLDPFEDVQVIHMPFSEAIDLVTGGQVIDGSLMLGLLLVAQRGLASSSESPPQDTTSRRGGRDAV